ncbi:uncharacterized protein LOC124142822 [Haliotis rufescens]|uniref:uncharacterized protein LOC124142822 n=1 Tax=Haliotis rufescens TaxID=6454 RepID=UPI001EB096D6|nr:uncharacterized protein LOC124142822 [Haliotis rufescens]
MRRIYKTVVYSCLSALAVLLYTGFQQTMHYDVSIRSENIVPSCPSVLRHMMTGAWFSRSLSAEEEDDIETYLRKGLYFMTRNGTFERPDKKCGNISYFGWMDRRKEAGWFRVLCEPRGSTPCCYDNVCQRKTIRECVCDGCYDLRTQKHAEYSNWIPEDSRCQVKNFTSKSACELLKGGTFHFYGDSLVRQMYLAFLIIVKGDYQHGGLVSNASVEIKQQCAGKYVFPYKNCRNHLDYSPTLCDGTVKAKFIYCGRFDHRATFMTDELKNILDTPKSIVMFGSGLWARFNKNYNSNFARAIIDPVRNHTKRKWPKLLWSGFSGFGLWRRELERGITNTNAQLYNRNMERIVGKYNVPMFDTFNLTRGVRSLDGTHYGPGVNFVKAQIYLNYLMELQNNGEWV